MQVKEALNWAAKKLSQAKIDSAPLDAEILLAFVLRKNKEWLFTYPEKRLTDKQLKKLQKLVYQRANGMPVAYLTGEKEFYGYKFTINKNVLIPRPMTEELVEKSLQSINQSFNYSINQLSIVDVGTGSGCIIISIANELRKKYGGLSQFKFYATDVSAKTLSVAQKNARLHRLSKNIKFYRGQLLEPLKKIKIDLIVANLPYLNPSDIKKEKSIQAEPKLALAGNFYPELFNQAKKYFGSPLIIYEDKKGIHNKH